MNIYRISKIKHGNKPIWDHLKPNITLSDVHSHIYTYIYMYTNICIFTSTC